MSGESAGLDQAVRAEVTMYPGGFANQKFAVYEAQQVASRPGESPLKALVDAPPIEDGSSYVVIRDLQPGVLYRWRLSAKSDNGTVATEVLEFRGPICPMDSDKASESEVSESGSKVPR
jgi:hypothetical protein